MLRQFRLRCVLPCVIRKHLYLIDRWPHICLQACDNNPIRMDTQQTGPAVAAAAAAGGFRRTWEDKEPEIIAVAPGRVCLIGEHIDYNGYSVVTMAVDRYCCCALTSTQLGDINTHIYDNDTTTVSSRSERAHKTNIEDRQRAAHEWFLAVRHSNGAEFGSLYIQEVEDIFPTLQAILQQQRTCGGGNHCERLDASGRTEWHAYILAGCLGALEFFLSHSPLSAGSITADSWEEFVKGVTAKLPKVSMKATVSGNLPLGSGLSSSSALVVSVATAITAALGCSATPKGVAEVCARAERYVGVQGGGMDQACICLARPGFATLTSFNPLAVEYLKLPETCILALGYCGADAMKMVDRDKKYNLRVLECKLAALLLMGARSSFPSPLQTLEHVNLSYVQAMFLGSLKDAVLAVESLLHEEPYGKEELERQLGGLLLQLFKELPALVGAWEKNTGFKLKQRARHVFSEAIRVREFADICKRDCSDEDTMTAIGRLVKASHLSCKTDFECSSEKLDSFVSCALAHGAVGSRLTGAGWGGFTVSFLPRSNEQEFEKKIDPFFAEYPPSTPRLLFSIPTDSLRLFFLKSTNAPATENQAFSERYVLKDSGRDEAERV